MQVKNKESKMPELSCYCLTTKDRAIKSTHWLIVVAFCFLFLVWTILTDNGMRVGRAFLVTVMTILSLPVIIRSVYEDRKAKERILLCVSRKGIEIKSNNNIDVDWRGIRRVSLSMKHTESSVRDYPCLSIDMRSTRKCYDFSLESMSYNPYQLRSALRNFSDGYDVEIDADRKLWMFFYCNPFHNGYKSE